MVAHRRTSGDRDPQLPPDLDLKTLPRAVRAELRGLSMEAAEFVGGHLVMAGQLVDSDPELAFAHAEAARRRAARLPIVREASAETAYAAGEYVHALSEYRALRRMTGNDEYLPVMADCERALGRYQDALELAREAKHAGLGPDLAAEALMVEAGVREDMGQAAEGLRLLKSATRVPVRGLSKGSRARLAYAYADLLLRTGDEAEAVGWFTTAADLDTEGVTDADERLARLQGMVLELDDAGIEGWAPEEDDEQEGDSRDEPEGDSRDEPEGDDGDDARDGTDEDDRVLGELPDADLGDDTGLDVDADTDLDVDAGLDVDSDGLDEEDAVLGDIGGDVDEAADDDETDGDAVLGELPDADLDDDDLDGADRDGDTTGAPDDADVTPGEDDADDTDVTPEEDDADQADVTTGDDDEDPTDGDDAVVTDDRDVAGPTGADAQDHAAGPEADEALDEDTAELGDRVAERVFGDDNGSGDDVAAGEAPGTDDDVDGLGDDVADRVFGEEDDDEDDAAGATAAGGLDGVLLDEGNDPADDTENLATGGASDEQTRAGVDGDRTDVTGTDRVDEEPVTILAEDDPAPAPDDEEPTTLLDEGRAGSAGDGSEDGPGSVRDVSEDRPDDEAPGTEGPQR